MLHPEDRPHLPSLIRQRVNSGILILIERSIDAALKHKLLRTNESDAPGIESMASDSESERRPARSDQHSRAFLMAALKAFRPSGLLDSSSPRSHCSSMLSSSSLTRLVRWLSRLASSLTEAMCALYC